MSTYEWHTDGIPVHMSDIRMKYEYIGVTCECMRVHKDKTLAHKIDIQMTCK